ncbi:hypothetical protein EDC96DRAFT_535318, partial [Choanephora cucurbitarum]
IHSVSIISVGTLVLTTLIVGISLVGMVIATECVCTAYSLVMGLLTGTYSAYIFMVGRVPFHPNLS